MMVLSCGEQGSSSASESSPSGDASPLEGVIEDMQSRIKRLERWHTINTVFPQHFFRKFNIYFKHLCILSWQLVNFEVFGAGTLDISNVCVSWVLNLPEEAAMRELCEIYLQKDIIRLDIRTMFVVGSPHLGWPFKRKSTRGILFDS